MDEIAQQFKEELQELLDRYKDKMSTPQIMHIAQPIFTKTIGFKDNPERFCSTEEHLKQILNSGPSFIERYALKGEWKSADELEGSAGRDAVAGVKQ